MRFVCQHLPDRGHCVPVPDGTQHVERVDDEVNFLRAEVLDQYRDRLFPNLLQLFFGEYSHARILRPQCVIEPADGNGVLDRAEHAEDEQVKFVVGPHAIRQPRHGIAGTHLLQGQDGPDREVSVCGIQKFGQRANDTISADQAQRVDDQFDRIAVIRLPQDPQQGRDRFLHAQLASRLYHHGLVGDGRTRQVRDDQFRVRD